MVRLAYLFLNSETYNFTLGFSLKYVFTKWELLLKENVRTTLSPNCYKSEFSFQLLTGTRLLRVVCSSTKPVQPAVWVSAPRRSLSVQTDPPSHGQHTNLPRRIHPTLTAHQPDKHGSWLKLCNHSILWCVNRQRQIYTQPQCMNLHRNMILMGLVQERHNSIADALKLRLSCTNTSILACKKDVPPLLMHWS